MKRQWNLALGSIALLATACVVERSPRGESA